MTDVTETDFGSAGMTYVSTRRTPGPGKWVVTDLSKVDFDGEVATGWELAWSVDGTEQGYRYYGTFGTREALLVALATVEGTAAVDRPSAAVQIADAGFERDRPVFSIGGVNYVRTMPDGRMAYLGKSMEVALTLYGPEVGRRTKIASVMPTSSHQALRTFGPPDDVAVAVCLALYAGISVRDVTA